MPTMNRIDMLNCAAGHHDFGDDASECHVCGHAQADASAPADLVRDAAPDMLAALKDAQEEIRAWRRWAKPGEGPEKPAVTSFVLDKIAAAIAKAEGAA